MTVVLLQAPAPPRAPTVGDTIWVARTVAVPAGATVRPADWSAPDAVGRLGPPRVTLRGDSATIAYPIVAWRAGQLTLEVPGPLLLRADSAVDSVAPAPVELWVASVLPPVPADSTLAPQPRAEFVPRPATSPVPLLILLGVAALLLVPLHWWWRRRGHPRPRPALPTAPADPPLERWADAEMCSDNEAKSDSETGTAHGAFGQCNEWAQNECPGWPGEPETMIAPCLQMMWDEGPGDDFNKHGHYINMSSTKYTKVACGYWITPAGKVWAVQNFK